MFDGALYFSDGWFNWSRVEIVTIRQAACLLSGYDPINYSMDHDRLPDVVSVMCIEMAQSIKSGSLKEFSAWGVDRDARGSVYPVVAVKDEPHVIISDKTEVKIVDLAAWADKRFLSHCWDIEGEAVREDFQLWKLPKELRIAVEAYNAVSSNAAFTAGRSPRSAIKEWLAVNHADLSSGAVDRISTVANWSPMGGAPKTPI